MQSDREIQLKPEKDVICRKSKDIIQPKHKSMKASIDKSYKNCIIVEGDEMAEKSMSNRDKSNY